jgi:hypothetical protein
VDSLPIHYLIVHCSSSPRKASAFVLVFHPTNNSNQHVPSATRTGRPAKHPRSTLIDLDDSFFGAKDEEYGQHGDITYRDQAREESTSLATAAAATVSPPRGRAAADD